MEMFQRFQVGMAVAAQEAGRGRGVFVDVEHADDLLQRLGQAAHPDRHRALGHAVRGGDIVVGKARGGGAQHGLRAGENGWFHDLPSG
jgi:hypothetical protein